MSGSRSSLLVLAFLAGCATVPSGPRVAVMPGPGISFEQFEVDDRACRDYADRSLGVDVNDAGANNLVAGAVVGTAIGAAAGALVGGHHAAATGAGVGLVAGSAVGAGNASEVQYDAQRRYDIAYEQCMYAKGHQLPRASRVTRRYRYRRYPDVVYEQAPTTVIIQEGPEELPPLPDAYPYPGASIPPPPPED
jgi:hypothetical protein